MSRSPYPRADKAAGAVFIAGLAAVWIMGLIGTYYSFTSEGCGWFTRAVLIFFDLFMGLVLLALLLPTKRRY